MHVTHSALARLPGKFSYSAFSADLDLTPARSLDEVVSLTPEEMSRASRLVSAEPRCSTPIAIKLPDTPRGSEAPPR
jgi:hypothetical protein